MLAHKFADGVQKEDLTWDVEDHCGNGTQGDSQQNHERRLDAADKQGSTASQVQTDGGHGTQPLHHGDVLDSAWSTDHCERDQEEDQYW